jgi:hypothetical protein
MVQPGTDRGTASIGTAGPDGTAGVALSGPDGAHGRGTCPALGSMSGPAQAAAAGGCHGT